MCHVEKVRVALARAGLGNGERQLVALAAVSSVPSPGSQPVPEAHPELGRVARSSMVRICSAEEALGPRSVTRVWFKLPSVLFWKAALLLGTGIPAELQPVCLSVCGQHRVAPVRCSLRALPLRVGRLCCAFFLPVITQRPKRSEPSSSYRLPQAAVPF